LVTLPRKTKYSKAKTRSLGYRRIKWQKTWHEKGKSLGVHETLNVAAWNVRSVGNKESELVEEIKIKGINVAVISETKKKLKGIKIIGNYTMLYRGVSQKTRAQSGVALLTLDNKFQNIFCICDEYVINLFVRIYEVRKGT